MCIRDRRDGLDDMPKANPAIRLLIEAQAAQKGWPALHAELALVDPVTAARLAPADSQRIARALEVYRISGLPMASFHTTKTVAASADSTRATGQNGLRLTNPSWLISLEPLDLSLIHIFAPQVKKQTRIAAKLGVLDVVFVVLVA